jgi:hypothetical protein
MGSMRLDLDHRLVLSGPLFAELGARTGYAYVAGKGLVRDAALGSDATAFMMAHRIPVRAYGALGVRLNPSSPMPIDIGLNASGGFDFAFVQAHSFGRTVTPFLAAPGVSTGVFLDVNVVDKFSIGTTAEWDSSVFSDLAAIAPGWSGDLSAFRIALHLSYRF